MCVIIPCVCVPQFTDTLDLEGLKSMDLQWFQQKKSKPIYRLNTTTETVQLKVNSGETLPDKLIL